MLQQSLKHWGPGWRVGEGMMKKKAYGSAWDNQIQQVEEGKGSG